MIASVRSPGPHGGPWSTAPGATTSSVGRVRRSTRSGARWSCGTGTAALLLALLLTGGCSAAVPQPDFPVNDPGLIADLDHQPRVDLRDPATNGTLTVASVEGFWDSAAQRAATSPETIPRRPELALLAPEPPAPGANSAPSSVLSVVSPEAPTVDTVPAPPPPASSRPSAVSPSDAPLVALGAGTGAAGAAVLGPTAEPFDALGLSARATGRLFFTAAGRPRSCTASVVNTSATSRNSSVVITAGHCLLSDGSDGPRTPAANIIFVPGYRLGAEPYGRFLAQAAQVTSGWAAGVDWSNDVGFVRLAPRGLTNAQETVGGYGMVFGAPTALGRVDLLGYPSAPPFDGSAARICRGAIAGPAGATDPADAGSQPLPCQMTAGYSGGPGLASPPVAGIPTDPAEVPANPGTAGSFIVGVGSHDYRRDTVYLTPLGEQALAALRQVTS